MNKKEYINDKIQKFYKDKYKQNSILNNKAIQNKENRRKGGIYLIYDNLKNRIYKTIKQNNLKFKFKYINIFGCDIEELNIYLTSKLQNNMTFENYGEWEVDHIIPVSKFNFENDESIFKCFHYLNLQPLWKAENRTKYNKINN